MSLMRDIDSIIKYSKLTTTYKYATLLALFLSMRALARR